MNVATAKVVAFFMPNFQLQDFLYIFSGMKNIKKVLIGVLVVIALISSNLITKTDWYKSQEKRVAQKDSIKLAEDLKERAKRMSVKNPDFVKFQVSNYLKSVLHNPDSYEPLEWSQIETSDSIIYMIEHSYRAKNQFNALVKETKIFKLDRAGKMVSAD